MPLSGPLPITARRRRNQFSVAPITRGKRGRVSRENSLNDYYSTGRKGINLKAFVIARRIPLKTGLYAKQGLTPRQIKLRQVLSLDNVVSRAADHAVKRFTTMGILPAMAKSSGINPEKLTSAELKDKMWEHVYGDTIKDLFKRVKDKEKRAGLKELVQNRVKVKKYLSVPQRVHSERTRHWAEFSKRVEKLVGAKVDPDENIQSEVQRILRRRISPRLKALDIAVAASLYADIILRTQVEALTEKQRDGLWQDSYSKAMEITYPLVEAQEDIVDSVIEFHKPRK